MENIVIPKTNTPEPKVNYNLNLLLLLGGRLVSQLGTAIFNFALSLYVLDITGSASAFSTVLAFGFIPGILVTIFAGVYVDKYDKKKIIVLSDILSGIAVVVFAFVLKLAPQSLWTIIGCQLLLNSFMAFYGLAIQAAIPNIVSEEGVGRANAVFQGLGPVINILGPILGAIAYSTGNMDLAQKALRIQWIFIFNGISFVLSGISEMFIVFQKSTPLKEDVENKSFRENFMAVFKYLATQPVIKFLMLFAVVINFVYNPLMFLVVPYINYNIIKVSGQQLSYIQSAAAVGTILGAVIVGMSKNTNSLLRKFFIMLLGQCILIALWVFPALPFFEKSSSGIITAIFSIILAAIAVLNTIQNIPMVTHFQLQIPEEIRGRVFSVFFTALTATAPIGIWLFGLMLQTLNWVYVPTISAALMIGLCIYASRSKIFKSFLRELKNDKGR